MVSGWMYILGLVNGGPIGLFAAEALALETGQLDGCWAKQVAGLKAKNIAFESFDVSKLYPSSDISPGTC